MLLLTTEIVLRIFSGCDIFLCVPSIAPATLTNSERVFSRKISIDAAVSAGVIGNLNENSGGSKSLQKFLF